MGLDTDFGQLTERITHVERTLENVLPSIRVIAAGHAQLVDQIAEITVAQQRADIEAEAQRKMLEGISMTLGKVHDVVITAHTGGRILRWAAPTIVAVTAATAAVKGWITKVLAFFTIA